MIQFSYQPTLPQRSVCRWQPLFMDRVYYLYSIFFVISRTFATFLLASTIHENSQKPLKVMRSIPLKGWTQEVTRFGIFKNLWGSQFSFLFLTKKRLRGSSIRSEMKPTLWQGWNVSAWQGAFCSLSSALSSRWSWFCCNMIKLTLTNWTGIVVSRKYRINFEVNFQQNLKVWKL